MSLTPELVILLGLFLWLLVLTFLFLRFYFYYTKLVRNGKKDSLVKILDELSDRQEEARKAIARLSSQYDKLEETGLTHIQKVGLVRFNPFKDTGGDQSFVLALVDAQDTGVVISSLHTRTGTRWYAKGVVKGRGIEHDLSVEEKKALEGARFLSSSEK